ncbi:hypothetical protein O9K51_11069 [Purpureocillium lavendulum]|uniref:BZIP domain-containing protein n=1 Tax=Purpureocillium lavendulum TaxID=1247861 RepID=A0AB34FBW6_9HYPO|nr:hypothetical protein O9K51_11069 [Purpureocillium lavendulum]
MPMQQPAEQYKVPKRKRKFLPVPGLARKRANDREAQRAIRARTKEYIAWLEREVEMLKHSQSRDHLVQGLLCANKMLEDELVHLRELFASQLTVQLITNKLFYTFY